MKKSAWSAISYIIILRILSSSVQSLHAISPLDCVGHLRYLLSFVDVVVVNVEEVVDVHTNNGGRRQGQGGTITASDDDNGVRDGALATKGAGTQRLTMYVNINVNVDNARMISAGKGG